MPKFADGLMSQQRRSPCAPEPVKATEDEIQALKAEGYKLSRKERRAEKAQLRKKAKRK